MCSSRGNYCPAVLAVAAIHVISGRSIPRLLSFLTTRLRIGISQVLIYPKPTYTILSKTGCASPALLILVRCSGILSSSSPTARDSKRANADGTSLARHPLQPYETRLNDQPAPAQTSALPGAWPPRPHLVTTGRVPLQAFSAVARLGRPDYHEKHSRKRIPRQISVKEAAMQHHQEHR